MPMAASKNAVSGRSHWGHLERRGPEDQQESCKKVLQVHRSVF